MTGLALATLGAVAALAQAEGQATPDQAAVQAAFQEYLNGGCASDDQAGCHHPFYAAVRRVRCTPQAGNRARCRFEERTEGFYVRRPRWRRAEHGFVYDAALNRWAMDCWTEATQTAHIIRCN